MGKLELLGKKKVKDADSILCMPRSFIRWVGSCVM